MIAAEGRGFHRLHVGRNGLSDLPGKGGHEGAYGKGPSPVHPVRQVQKAHGHVFGLLAGSCKITKYLFSIFHFILFPVRNRRDRTPSPLIFLFSCHGV